MRIYFFFNVTRQNVILYRENWFKRGGHRYIRTFFVPLLRSFDFKSLRYYTWWLKWSRAVNIDLSRFPQQVLSVTRVCDFSTDLTRYPHCVKTSYIPLYILKRTHIYRVRDFIPRAYVHFLTARYRPSYKLAPVCLSQEFHITQ